MPSKVPPSQLSVVPPSFTHDAAAADPAASEARTTCEPTDEKAPEGAALPLAVLGTKRPKWVSNLLELPPDLLLKILGDLDSESRGNARRAHSLLNNIGSEHITHLRFDKPNKLKEAVEIYTRCKQSHKIRSIILVGKDFSNEHVNMLTNLPICRSCALPGAKILPTSARTAYPACLI